MAKQAFASRRTVEQTLAQLRKRDNLTPLIRERLGKLVALIDEDGQINYAQAYEALFPGSLGDKRAKTLADKNFSKFRRELNTRAATQNISLTLSVDNAKRASSQDRHMGFVCEDNPQARVEIAGGTVSRPEDWQPSKMVLGGDPHYLWLYHPDDRTLARRLHDKLVPELRARDCQWQALDFYDLGLGETITTQQAAVLRRADFVIAVLTPSLIAELKTTHLGETLAESHQQILALAMLRIDEAQLAGTPCEGDHVHGLSKPYRGQSGDAADRWVADLAKKLTEFEHSSAGQEHPEESLAIDECETDEMHPKARGIAFGRQFKPVLEQHVEHYAPHMLGQSGKKSRDALAAIHEWLRTENSPPLCAIFGELGSGKTTLCQQLTRNLLDADDASHTPIYLDLRAVNAMPGWAKNQAPPLDAMLEHILSTTYNIRAEDRGALPTADDIAWLAQQGRGLIIIDGLDEVMNRLDKPERQAFIATLWRILPPIAWQDSDEYHGGKMLVTCRSHYFETLREQTNALSGQQREAVKKAHYLWYDLLPLNAQQVRNYYRSVFSAQPERADLVIRMLDQVHDLADLSTRPYTMNLIQHQVERLEQLSKRQQGVTSVDLYEGMVDEWLLRDEGKHCLTRDHKLLMMEQLALRLWQSDTRSVEHSDLANWLTDRLLENERWQLHYGSYLNRDNGIETLQHDLHNATFLVRQGEGAFRFAHTSIMEFFLSRALHRALLDGDFSVWKIPKPSVETWDFLGELIGQRNTDVCLANAQRLREHYLADASENLLDYALRALDSGAPGATFRRFDLTGAQLAELQPGLAGYEPHSFESPASLTPRGILDFSGSKFIGTNLRRSDFRDIDFSGSQFDQADLTACVFDQCTLVGATAQDADFSGTRLHDCNASEDDLLGANLRQTQWLFNNVSNKVPVVFDRSPTECFVSAAQRPVANGKPVSMLGHPGLVGVVVADPTGQWIASASHDGTVRLWDVKSGQCRQNMQGHKSRVNTLAVHPNGQWIASAGCDSTVKLWDVKSGQCHRNMQGHKGGVNALAVDPNGQWIASASDDSTVKLWDVKSGTCLHDMQRHEDWVSTLSVHPNRQWIVSASHDGTVKLWDIKSGQCRQNMQGHKGWVSALATHPNGRWVTSAGDDGTVKLWDIKSGQCLHSMKGHKGQVSALAIHPNGQWIASAGDDGIVKLWDVKSGQCLHNMHGHEDWVSVLMVDPNGQWIASASDDSTVKVWDVRSGQCLHNMRGHKGWVSALAIDPNGQWIASASHDSTVKLWDVKSGEYLHNIQSHRSQVSVLAVAPKGQWVASAGGDNTVKLWDIDSGRCLHNMQGHKRKINALAVSPNGQWVASASHDSTVKLWDVNSGKCLHNMLGHKRAVSALVIDPNGQWVASASHDNTVRLWDVKSGTCLHSMQGHRDWVNALVTHPNGRWIASADGDGTIKLWNVKSGECLRTMQGHINLVSALAVHPNRRWIASAGYDSTVKLWDVKSGECRQNMEGRRSKFHVLAVDPNGRWIASAGQDRTVKLWDVESGKCLHNMQGHQDWIHALAVDSHGRWIASAGKDRTIKFWDLKSGRCLHNMQGLEDSVSALAVDPNGQWIASASGATVSCWRVDPSAEQVEQLRRFQHLPDGNWVSWYPSKASPSGFAWGHQSRDAWRWLGWHAPLPDSPAEGPDAVYTMYPADYFQLPKDP